MHKAIVPSDNIGRWIDFQELEAGSDAANEASSAGARPPPAEDELERPPSAPRADAPLRYRAFEALAHRFRQD